MKKTAAFFLRLFIAGALCAAMASPAFGFEFLYQQSETIELSKGVTYEVKKIATEAGLLDVYVLRAPTSDEYISVKPLNSKTEFGLKETTSKIVNDNLGLAGINGDFFGMGGSYSTPLGLAVADGEVITQSAGQNAQSNESVSFFMGYDNLPYLSFFKCSVDFINNGEENFNIYSVNRVHDLTDPAVVDRAAMEDTASVDERFPGTYKIVCDGESIVYISQKGETVEVPEDGYVVIANEATFLERQNHIAVGQTAELLVQNSVDLDGVKSAISGAGKILENGVVTGNGFAPGGRQPRTAVGISLDRQTVIFAVVDGRSHSVGATHEEMGQIMSLLGAYQAMHLDGGGSTTMAVRKPGDDAAGLVNTPSDGDQRKIMNVLGVVDNAPVGEVLELALEPEVDSILTTANAPMEVYGFDEYKHKISIDPSLVAYTVESGSGTVFDGDFFPSGKGDAVISAEFNGLKASCEISVSDLAEIRPSVSSMYMQPGEKAEISVAGVNTNGDNVDIDENTVFYKVVPEDLGVMEGNVYNSHKTGQGYIQVASGSVSAYIPIYSSLAERAVNGADKDIKVSYTGYPEAVAGSAAFSEEKSADGNGSVKLSYEMGKSDGTQAAYAVFEGMTMPGEPKELRISCFGNNSGLWLRGKVVDKNGAAYTVDFSKKINFEGFADLTAKIPQNAAYPVTLERIYVASLAGEDPRAGSIYIDNIRGMYIDAAGGVEAPKSNQYVDPAKLAAVDLDCLGVSLELTKDKPSGFSTEYKNNILKINLDTYNGGVINTAHSQWRYIEGALMTDKTSNIVIRTDVNPRHFKTYKEYELLHNLLKKYAELGKDILVVSNEDGADSAVKADGVTYINIGARGEAETNKGGSILKINANEGLKYAFDVQR